MFDLSRHHALLFATHGPRMTSADLVNARKRVEARRAQRCQNQNQNRIQNGARPDDASAIGKLSPVERVIQSSSVTGIWNILKGYEGTKPASRVRQVDTELLDQELLGLLQGQVREALKFYRPYLLDEWSSEILLVLQTILFKLTIWDNNASYGAALQGLQYADARSSDLIRSPPTSWQKSLYGLITVGGSYAWTKWSDWLLERESRVEESSSKTQLLNKLTDHLSAIHSVAAFASFLAFLLHGRYRTLVDRVLRLRLVPGTSQLRNEVSFEYLNRQLVWHAFTEFLLFMLPLVGIRRWRRWLARAWQAFISFVTGTKGIDSDEQRSTGEYAYLPDRTCAICYEDQTLAASSSEDAQKISALSSSSGIVGSAQTDITTPYETIPCGCAYCFVCLAQRLKLEEGSPWTCLRCGTEVKECQPWNGDLLNPSMGQINDDDEGDYHKHRADEKSSIM